MNVFWARITFAIFLLVGLSVAQTDVPVRAPTADGASTGGVAGDNGDNNDNDVGADVPGRPPASVSDTVLASIDTASPAAPDTLTVAADSLKKGNTDLTDTVYYESDFVDYDNDARMLHLFGRAQVKYQNITLQADTIVYDVENNQFQARGRPQLVDGNDTTVGEMMTYNIKTRRGRVKYSTVRFDDTYFTGENIVKSAENCLYIENGDYTTCSNPNHPHYFFYSAQVKVVPEDMAVGRPVVFNVGDAPMAILPFFVMPLQRGRRSGWLTPSWGGSVARGGYIDNIGYYYAPNDYCDFTLSAKAQEFSSFVFNAGGRYALRYKLDGAVTARYALDNRLNSESQQWALDYRHNQNLTPDGRTTLYGSGSILSNRSFNQMYSEETSVLEQQQLDANMALSHKFQRINASTNLVWRRNHNLTTDRIQEDMPSFDFNLHNRAFVPYNAASGGDPSWYNNIYYSYNTKANVRRDVYGNDSLPGFTKPGMEHKVNLNSSQKLFKYFDISPYINMNASMFYGAIDTAIRKDTLVQDTVRYLVRASSKDTRYPDYTLLSEDCDYDLEYQDTICYIEKLSPLYRRIERDTFPDEFNLVRSWNAGVNLSTRIYGLFPINTFGVTAIRHTMTPTVGYSYVPKHDLDRMFYDVRINYDRPREKASQFVNLSLANTFQGKRIVKAATNTGGGKGRWGGVEAGGDEAGDNADNADHNDNAAGGDAIADTTRSTLSPPSPDTDTAKTTDTATAAPATREEKFDILSLSLGTSYDFEADERRWRDLSLSASTSLNILRLSHSSVYWMYDESGAQVFPIMRSYSFDLTAGSLGAKGTFWDGNLFEIDTARYGDLRRSRRGADPQSWDMSLSPGFNYRAARTTPSDRFVPTKSFNLSATAGMNITRDLSVRWNGNYDFSSNRFSHNNYSFVYDLECWEMRFTWRPERINPGFHFVVNVKKIPDIKYEQKESRTTSSWGGML